MKNKIKIAWLSFKTTYGYLDLESFLFIKLINPFFQMFFFVCLSVFTQSEERLAASVMGNAMLLCSFGCLGDLGMMYVREQYNGTLKLLLASNKNRLMLFLEKGSIHIIESFLTTLFGLCIGYFVFKIPLFDYPIFTILFVIFISTFTCVCLGFLFSSFCLLLSDINLIYNILTMSMVFLCGANISVSSLPVFLQYISYCLPITRGLEAVNRLINKDDLISVLPLVLEELTLAIILLVLATFLFTILEKQAKRKATIDLM